MKKIKIIPAVEHTNVQRQEKAYLVRFEVAKGAFIARYFKIFTQDETSGETLEQELEAFDPDQTPLMRQLVNAHKFYAGKVVSALPEMADAVLREIGRQIFKPQIGAGSVVGAAEKYDFPLYVLPFAGVDSVGEPYNHFVESAQVKGPVHRNGRMRGNKPVFLFYSAKSNDPIDEWTLCLVDTSAFVFDDLTPGEWQVENSFSPINLLPKIKLTAPSSISANGSAVLDVAMHSLDGAALSYTGELCVEAVDGYVPKSRVKIANGVGQFKVMALGLDAGDVMRIKVGTRLVSGLAETSIAVT